MRLLFLDIDGVLNSRQTYNKDLPDFHGLGKLDPECVRNLNLITRTTGCGLVLSSAWRHEILMGAMTPAQFAQSMREFGVEGEFVGITPYIPGGVFRAEEIRAWLLTHEQTGTFVVVDDDSDAEIPGRFVLTDFEYGLTEEKAQEVIRLMNDGSL
jgi:hypothetical protein